MRKLIHKLKENILKIKLTNKSIIPAHCKKCNSKNIIGYGKVIGMAYINLENMEVDELGDDFRICDSEKGYDSGLIYLLGLQF